MGSALPCEVGCCLQVGFIADLNNVPGHDVVEKVRHRRSLSPRSTEGAAS